MAWLRPVGPYARQGRALLLLGAALSVPLSLLGGSLPAAARLGGLAVGFALMVGGGFLSGWRPAPGRDGPGAGRESRFRPPPWPFVAGLLLAVANFWSLGRRNRLSLDEAAFPELHLALYWAAASLAALGLFLWLRPTPPDRPARKAGPLPPALAVVGFAVAFVVLLALQQGAFAEAQGPVWRGGETSWATLGEGTLHGTAAGAGLLAPVSPNAEVDLGELALPVGTERLELRLDPAEGSLTGEVQAGGAWEALEVTGGADGRYEVHDGRLSGSRVRFHFEAFAEAADRQVTLDAVFQEERSLACWYEGSQPQPPPERPCSEPDPAWVPASPPR